MSLRTAIVYTMAWLAAQKKGPKKYFSSGADFGRWAEVFRIYTENLMKTMFNYARTIIHALCHDYYNETCVLLMLLTLLATVACLWIALANRPTGTPGAGDARTLRVERRRHQA